MKSIKDYINESLEVQTIEEARTCVSMLNWGSDYEDACDMVDTWADDLEAVTASKIRSIFRNNTEDYCSVIKYIAAWMRGMISELRDDENPDGAPAFFDFSEGAEQWMGYDMYFEDFAEDYKVSNDQEDYLKGILDEVFDNWDAICKKLLGYPWGK